jgi:hypothetical protein
MKLSLATSLLLSSVPLALSFSVSGPRSARSSSSSSSSSSTQLRYQEDGSPNFGVDINVDVDAAVSRLSVDDDSHLVESLAFSLDMDDDFLTAQYNAWAQTYTKLTSDSSFKVWKRNFLMQEVWNRTNGETFDLNQFGDMTKEEFDHKFNTMKTGAAAQDDTTGASASASASSSSTDIPDASHAFHFEEHYDHPAQPQSEPEPEPEPEPSPQMTKFKQVKTFSGGFRLVPCTDSNNSGLLTAASTRNPTNTIRQQQPPKQPAVVANPPPTQRRNGFRKVALLTTTTVN